MKRKVVIIGCGWAGQVHARLLREHPEVEVVAVVDPDYAKAQELAVEVGARACASLEELVAAELDFHAASVCTPLASHFAICRTLIELGKQVLCEKPLTATLAQAKQLEELAERHGADLRVNYNQRFAAPIQKLKEHLSRNEQVHLVKISMFQHPPQVEGATEKYFLVSEACCHLIDTLLYLNGEIQQVHAYGRMADQSILYDVTVNLAFANGSIGVLTNTFMGGIRDSQHPFHYVEVITNRARYFVDNLYDGLWVHPHDELTRQFWAPSVFVPRDYTASMRASIWAWVDALLGKGGPAVTLAEGRQNMQVVAAIIESLKKNVPVDVQA